MTTSKNTPYLPIVVHAQHDVVVGSDGPLTIPRLDVPVTQELASTSCNDFPLGWMQYES